MSLLHIGIKTK